MADPAPGQLNLGEVPLGGSRGIDCFEKLEQIGEGTYGQVYMAKDKETGEIVALKKIITITEREGFDITSIREINILQRLDHQNVIRLKEIVISPGEEKDEQGSPVDGDKYKGSIYMVFDYMDHDLSGLLRTGIRFSIPQIKCYMRQLLTGLQYCHDNNVLHRDIKSANLLIDNEGNLKLADFGLARIFFGYPNDILTNRVISLWYRPPELLMGSQKYGPEIDMWSVGCVFGELLLGKPIFRGKNELNQLKRIFEKCGIPDENNWPGVTQMPWYNDITDAIVHYPMERRIGEVFKDFDHYALDLLEKMLTLDPKKRISDKDALDDEYFSTDPLPCDTKSLPKYEPAHEFQTRKKLQQQRQQVEAAKRQSHLPPRPPVMPGPSQPMHVSQPPMAASGSRGAITFGSFGDSGPNYPQGGQSGSSGHGCRPSNTRNE
ncbi:cyclin-dependent kinase C-1-like isoform X2 [Carex rostrata]